MKNLKKVLALVLVVAMMASFASVSAAFPDADSINYETAVNVLNGLGVIGGYADGTFRPTNLVTRGAMAKMVAYVLNGGVNAAASYGVAADTAFDDVAVADTYANAIGYVVSKGIVSGYADGTFRASNNVTGVAAAKMLLGALGYNADSEGFQNNTNWTVNVINAGEEAGLFKGMATVDLSANLTREAAAQMIWNALNAKTVKYTTSGTTITAGDITITTGAIREEVKNEETEIFVDDDKMQLAEKCFPKLAAGAGTTDSFGRPGIEYKLDGKVIATMIETAAKTYTTPVTGAGLYKDFGLKAATTVDIVANNGKNVTSYSSVAVAAEGAAITVAGETTEVFVDAKGVPTKLVVVSPEVTTVSDVAAVAATKTAGAYSLYTFANGLTAKVFSTVVDATKDITTLHGTCAKGETVLVNVDKNGDVYVSPLTVVNGVVSAYNATTGVYTIGGTNYVPAAKGTASLAVSKTPVDVYVSGSYVWANKGAGAGPAATYGMVIGADYTTALVDGKLITTYDLTVATTAGTVETLVVAKADYDTYAAMTAGDVVEYKYDAVNKVYTVKEATTTAVTSLTTNKVELVSGLYGNASTLFVFADFNAQGKLTGTVTTVTGVANVANYASVDAEAMDLTAVADKIADVVFVKNSVNATTTVKALTYVVPGYTQTLDGYVYNTITAGVAGTITLPDTINAGMYSEIAVTGNVVTPTPASTTHASVKYVGGLLLDGSDALIGTVAANAPVYTIAASNLTYAASTGAAAELTTAVTGDIYVLSTNGVVNAIYVVK